MFLDILFYIPLNVYLSLVVVLLLWLSTRRPPGFPPGPPLLPLLGNALSLDSDPQITFRKLRRQYGDIFSVYIFNKPVIVLNGYKVIKDALVKNGGDFSARPPSLLSDHVSQGKGIVFSLGDIWQEHRTFTIKAMKKLGMGQNSLEDKVREELSFLLQYLSRNAKQEVDLSHVIHMAVCNMISFLEFDHRFDYEEQTLVEILRLLDENITNFKSANVVNILPAVRYIPGDVFNFKRILNNSNAIVEKIVRPFLQEHLSDEQDTKHDFTSLYIAEMKNRNIESFETTLDEKNLTISLLDLFIAGSETTGTVIRWALVYFLNYPDVQEKCFQEIQEKIGLNKSPSMKDKTSLPYLEATIAETLRLCDAVPANLPHTVSRDVHFHGYFFPKGVTILPLLNSVLSDPEVWGDPESFRPERFLDSDGKFVRNEELIPFSIGRRECLGEPLARMELFLFLTGMLQKFEFRRGKDGPPSMNCCPGVINRPFPYTVTIVPRLGSEQENT